MVLQTKVAEFNPLGAYHLPQSSKEGPPPFKRSNAGSNPVCGTTSTPACGLQDPALRTLERVFDSPRGIEGRAELALRTVHCFGVGFSGVLMF